MKRIFPLFLGFLLACGPADLPGPSYQTVTMLSSLGQTPQFQAEKGRSQIRFAQGDRQLNFHLQLGQFIQGFSTQQIADCTRAECIANDPEYKDLLGSERLAKFKLATGTLTVGETQLKLEVRAEALNEDLSYALELLELAEGTRVQIEGSAFDSEGNVQGSLRFDQTITEAVDTVTLERLLGELQADINLRP